MRRLHKNSTDPPKSSDLESDDVSRDQHTRFGGLNPLKLMGGFVVCLMGLSVLFSVSVIFKDFTIWDSATDVAHGDASRILYVGPHRDLEQEDDPLASFVMHKKKLPSSGVEHGDKLLNGLLSSRFDEDSCLSRYQAASYRKESPYKPSSYLVSRLRRYEALHQRCGPHTESYNRAVAKLRSGETPEEGSDCNYLVWVSYSGLGNRILTLGSAFLYALLTNRVLLVDRGADLNDLFCEPFPEASWLLPLDFPIIDHFKNLNQQSPECFGNMLKTSSNSSSLSPYVYLHLVHDYNDHDKLFFCDQDQSFLQNVSWVIMKSDNYFIPSLFLMPTFEQELHTLFPEKETVFHFLGRYLFFPTNPVWGLITRYYNSYLAEADERIGIQVRVFDTRPGPFQYVLDQILACSFDNNMLPEISSNESLVASPGNQKSKAVLMTSLSSGYFEKIRDMYWEHATVTGEVVEVFQPSHEGYQQTEKKMHHRKAWAEMYLLSLTDKLITSSWSTFGYVAQSLGGLNPWILYKPENETTPNPACIRALSIEPCFHAPPFFDCKKRTGIDTGVIVPHVRHCEDMSWGLKLVNPRVDSIA
ncbi:galactoside 2-alpha-L-fucosyltransferase [Artemisia annua]|uniref:Fucosyltransferase n=1 Tax=Artemisia annua TaxID=35608 RepID=A0A2U1N8K2_ARTAN|nr:galactoside 2-alpha-L-fucosyltransferase [Artemisia annua]